MVKIRPIESNNHNKLSIIEKQTLLWTQRLMRIIVNLKMFYILMYDDHKYILYIKFHNSVIL